MSDLSNSEKDESWNAFIDLNLKASEEIRKELNIPDEEFLIVHGQAWANTKHYLIYTALDEVQKMSFYLIRIRESLEGEILRPREETLQRLLYEEINEEQQAKIRRLLEILIVLILFEQTNENEYYRHFIEVEELQQLLFSNKDLEDFYTARSANIDDTIENQKKWISQTETKIDLNKCWYLKNQIGIYEQNYKTGIMSSFRARIVQALPYMLSLEKILFGYSYQGAFSTSSQIIHYSPLKNCNIPEEIVPSLHQYLGLLGFSIINRISRINDIANLSHVKLIVESLDKLNPDDLVFLHTVRDFKVGDFVLAYGDLAEILEIKDSFYGYRAYHILYLAEKPKPDIQEDWFPAKYIQRVFEAEDIKKKVIARLKEDSSITDEDLEKSDWKKILRNSVLAIWKLGLKDHLRKGR